MRKCWMFPASFVCASALSGCQLPQTPEEWRNYFLEQNPVGSEELLVDTSLPPLDYSDGYAAQVIYSSPLRDAEQSLEALLHEPGSTWTTFRLEKHQTLDLLVAFPRPFSTVYARVYGPAGLEVTGSSAVLLQLAKERQTGKTLAGYKDDGDRSVHGVTQETITPEVFGGELIFPVGYTPERTFMLEISLPEHIHLADVGIDWLYAE